MEEFLGKLPTTVISKIMMFNSHPVADLFKQSESYMYYDEESTFYHTENRYQTFSEYYFEQYMLDNSCDCCAKVWRDCQCWCSNCGDEHKCCKASCHDSKTSQPTDRWCCSCDRYYTGHAICCPGCD